QGIPPRPLNMTAIEATNRGRAEMDWAMLTSSPRVREVNQDDLRKRPAREAVLDVREPAEFVNGHVPGAVNLPQAELASRLGEVPRDRPILVICQSGFRSRRAAQFLSQCGSTDVASVKGGTEGWRAAGGELVRESPAAPQQNVIETEWAHAGGDCYAIWWQLKLLRAI